MLDSVLPVFVDYLGRFESEPGYVETSADIAREAKTYMTSALDGKECNTNLCGAKSSQPMWDRNQLFNIQEHELP